jgi:hypothetical protein
VNRSFPPFSVISALRHSVTAAPFDLSYLSNREGPLSQFGRSVKGTF